MANEQANGQVSDTRLLNEAKCVLGIYRKTPLQLASGATRVFEELLRTKAGTIEAQEASEKAFRACDSVVEMLRIDNVRLSGKLRESESVISNLKAELSVRSHTDEEYNALVAQIEELKREIEKLKNEPDYIFNPDALIMCSHADECNAPCEYKTPQRLTKCGYVSGSVLAPYIPQESVQADATAEAES